MKFFKNLKLNSVVKNWMTVCVATFLLQYAGYILTISSSASTKSAT